MIRMPGTDHDSGRNRRARLNVEPLEDRCTPATFAEPGALPIPDDSFFITSLDVSGLAGTVTRVTVTLQNLSHTFPRDLDIVLQSPDSLHQVMLLSDVGNDLGADAVSLTLTFDDAAVNTVPEPPVSGRFRPTNKAVGPADLAGPAIPPGFSGPTASTLAAFNGINPNGSWRLVLVDDFVTETGLLAGGWALDIETAIQAATNVTATTAVALGRPQVRRSRTRQTVTLTNNGSVPYVSQVSLLLSGLKRKVTVVGPTGTSAVFAPSNPFVSLVLGGDGDLDPGESITFNLVFKNPTGRKFRFTPLIVAGLGTL